VESIQAAGNLITALRMMGLSTGWPPVAAGSFWLIIGLWGLISIFFDDEVPRGIPGLEEMNDIRSAREANYQREHKG
jgi:hypothetical protein